MLASPLTVPAVVSRAIALAAHPSGLPRPDDFTLVEVPLPAPGPGEVLVRNRCFRVSASLRVMISAEAEPIRGIPHRPLVPGDLIGGAALGEVVLAGPGAALAPGDLVLHHLGWRDHALVTESAVQRVGPGTDPAAALGHGWTAYAALTRGVEIRAGDTVLVTAGGSAIGSVAGQLARLLGAGRVLATTSTPAKARQLVDDLGYDAALARGAPASLAEQLAAAAPDGIDVLVDNVGGEQLAIALEAARPHARFVLLGSLAGQLAATGSGQQAPAVIDSALLPTRAVTLRGYSADDDPQAQAEWHARSRVWLRDGVLTLPHATVPGLDRAPDALARAIAGELVGVVLVEL